MRKLFLIILMLFVVGAGNLFAQTEIVILTEDFPPLNFVAVDKPVGPAVEIVQEIQKKLGLKNEIKIYPWKRAYSKTFHENNTCLFSTTKTPKRESEFKWVGPLAEKRYVLFAAKSSHIKLKTLEDAKNYSVGVQMGGASEEFLKSKGFTNLDSAIKPEHSMKKLNVGRIDLWYTSTVTPLILAQKAGIEIDEFEEVFVIKKSILYIAFNKKTRNDLINKWQKARDELYKDGTIKKIFDKYGYGSMMPKFK